jgi:hypothetical protein
VNQVSSLVYQVLLKQELARLKSNENDADTHSSGYRTVDGEPWGGGRSRLVGVNEVR